MCRHEVNFLLGTADGIVCRKCGAKFASFEEITAASGDAPQAAPEAPAPQDKPKAQRGRKKKEE